MKRFLIFVSSVQKEMQRERAEIRRYIEGDPLLKRYFRVFRFEDVPATDKKADELYLKHVEKCDVYLGIFGNKYGQRGQDGFSPTEREFRRATEGGKFRLVFIRGVDDRFRDERMLALIHEAGRQLIRRRFADLPDLTAQLYASLVQYLDEKGAIKSLPFDASECEGVSLRDISSEKMRWFLHRARMERKFALKEKTTPTKALAHMSLLNGGKPTHAAVLLFGNDPQRFIMQAETKCLYFYGVRVEKPVPSYQVFKGTAFEQIDQALEFVLSKINRSVIPQRGKADVRHESEIPDGVVREAIVNAVAHRDYTSNAGVQVMVFSDRIEIWNPGELPAGLTPENLREEHPSIPRNPLVCDSLFLARYIEKAGTGTLDMIRSCREAALPEPEFVQRGSHFVVTVRRDLFTESMLAELGLNDRQKKAVAFVKVQDRVTNREYQKITGATRKTAVRDLSELVKKGVLVKIGAGRGVRYVMNWKRDKKGTSGT